MRSLLENENQPSLHPAWARVNVKFDAELTHVGVQPGLAALSWNGKNHFLPHVIPEITHVPQSPGRSYYLTG